MFLQNKIWNIPFDTKEVRWKLMQVLIILFWTDFSLFWSSYYFHFNSGNLGTFTIIIVVKLNYHLFATEWFFSVIFLFSIIFLLIFAIILCECLYHGKILDITYLCIFFLFCHKLRKNVLPAILLFYSRIFKFERVLIITALSGTFCSTD